MTHPIQEIHALGQSIWYDNIQRRLLENGEMAAMIERGEIRGVTSNPSIFNNAIAKSNDYDAALIPLAAQGLDAKEIYEQLAIADIRAAADLFASLYEETGGGDGYVSLEVSPYLAHDTEATCAEAQRLWDLVDRPNLMVKIPATPEGLPAVESAIAAGINVNVTLIFSNTRYGEVMEAYLSGLEKRLDAGEPVDHVASVASFFVSRIDTKVDGWLNEVAGSHAELARSLRGKIAIANAKAAYANFKEVFGSERFTSLKTRGARLQRPLWASTSTKNSDYSEVLYIEELIGPDTVNTVPPKTLEAFKDHGAARRSVDADLYIAQKHLQDLAFLGLSLDQATQELEQEGVAAFAAAFTALLEAIETRRANT